MRFFVDSNGPVKWHAENFKKRQSKIKNKDTHSQATYQAFDERIKIGVSSQNSVDGYKQFFENRLDGQRYFCEITPSYMTLPRADLAQIKTAFDDVKVLFLMRDPIARLWSMVRFNYRNKPKQEMNNFAQSCLSISNYKKRCDYKSALENIDAVFDKGQVFIGFYEDLFHSDLLSRLYAFLDIPPIKADFNLIKNQSGSAAMPNDVAEYFATELAQQYDFLRARFGDKIPDDWLL